MFVVVSNRVDRFGVELDRIRVVVGDGSWVVLMDTTVQGEPILASGGVAGGTGWFSI